MWPHAVTFIDTDAAALCRRSAQLALSWGNNRHANQVLWPPEKSSPRCPCREQESSTRPPEVLYHLRCSYQHTHYLGITRSRASLHSHFHLSSVDHNWWERRTRRSEVHDAHATNPPHQYAHHPARHAPTTPTTLQSSDKLRIRHDELPTHNT